MRNVLLAALFCVGYFCMIDDQQALGALQTVFGYIWQARQKICAHELFQSIRYWAIWLVPAAHYIFGRK